MVSLLIAKHVEDLKISLVKVAISGPKREVVSESGDKDFEEDMKKLEHVVNLRM